MCVSRHSAGDLLAAKFIGLWIKPTHDVIPAAGWKPPSVDIIHSALESRGAERASQAMQGPRRVTQEAATRMDGRFDRTDFWSGIPASGSEAPSVDPLDFKPSALLPW